MLESLLKSRFKVNAWGIAVLSLVSGFPTAQAFQFKVSADSAQLLQRLDSRMTEVASEFRLNCVIQEGQGVCRTLVHSLGATPIVQEVIAHPFYEDAWIAYRITRGSPEFRSAFYHSLEGIAASRALPNAISERRIKLEGGQFSIRCTEGLTEQGEVDHHCWLIVGASLFDQVVSD